MIQSMVIIWERQNDLTNCSYISWNNAWYLAMTPYWLKIRHITSGNLSCALPNFISAEVFKRVLKSPEKISKSDLNLYVHLPFSPFLDCICQKSKVYPLEIHLFRNHQVISVWIPLDYLVTHIYLGIMGIVYRNIHENSWFVNLLNKFS